MTDDELPDKWLPKAGWPTSHQAQCPHGEFEADIDVARIVEAEDGPCTAICVDVRVRCAECGLQLEFLKLPHAISTTVPNVGLSRTCVSLPAKPFGLELATPEVPPIEIRVTHTDYTKPGDLM